MSNTEHAKYKRNKTLGYKHIAWRRAKRIGPGLLIEFQYGAKKNIGESGGWKGDPKPILLVLYDDHKEYIEGINTNYLNQKFLNELMKVLAMMPGVSQDYNNGKQLYKMLKEISPDILKGYRKYKRNVIRRIWKLEVNLTNEEE